MNKLLLLFCCLWLGAAQAQYALTIGPKQITLKENTEISITEFSHDSVVFTAPQKFVSMSVLVANAQSRVTQAFMIQGSVFPPSVIAALQKSVNGKMVIHQYETADHHKHICALTLLLKP